MGVIQTIPLSDTVGAEVLDVDQDRLVHDEKLPEACLDTLDQNGVLLFRQLGLDDEAQVAFCRRLGEVVRVPSHRIPEITEISLDLDNPLAEYFRGAFHWHIDGTMDEIPSKASVMTAHVVTEEGGETEFASTYAAYDQLSEEEHERYGALRVVHSFESSQRPLHPNPTPEQEADWARRPPREHPLVWRHRSGRCSLVVGVTVSHVVGMDPEEGRALLDDLLERTTAPERIFRHRWSVGDMVIWDNRGVVHRARPYEPSAPREMHRCTLVGDEPIR